MTAPCTCPRLSGSPPPAPRRVLVVRAGAIGDFVLTLPALVALRRAYPLARLHLVGNRAAAVLALESGTVDAVYSFDDAWVARLFTPTPAAATAPLADVDFAVVWLRDPESPLVASLGALGVPTLAAPSFPPPGARVHVADHLLSALHPLGISPGDAIPRLALSRAGLQRADDLLTRHRLGPPARIVAIHPGSGGRYKSWPAERFAAVADALAVGGVQSLLLAGPADAEQIGLVRRSLRRASPLEARPGDLIELAAILARCDAYLGNDSGVSHLAAAVGAPTVAIFGPTDPAVWAPRGERVTVLWKGSPGAVDPRLALPDRGEALLDRVEVDEVVRAVESLLR